MSLEELFRVISTVNMYYTSTYVDLYVNMFI